MADGGEMPYLPERAHTSAPERAATPSLFTPKPLTMADLLAETAPAPKAPRRKITLSPRAAIRRRERLSPAR